MFKSFDLRQKQVIDVKTAEVIGYIRDIDIDVESGRIVSVTIPKKGVLGLFKRGRNAQVAWENIVAIGNEFVLVRDFDDKFSENR